MAQWQVKFPRGVLEEKLSGDEWPKLAKIYTLFMTKMAENPILWGRTYLYSPYKAMTPSPGKNYCRYDCAISASVFEQWLGATDQASSRQRNKMYDLPVYSLVQTINTGEKFKNLES